MSFTSQRLTGLRDTLVVACALLACLPLAGRAAPATVFIHQYNYGENNTITTPNYEAELILLALQKTEAEYGPFKLQALQGAMINQPRAIELMSAHTFPNYIRTFGYQEFLSTEKDLVYIKFPAYRGVLSYRTCFMAKAIGEQLKKVDSLAELRKFSIGQGIGWADGVVLRHNGFLVREINLNQSLFKMTALNRVNLFCRGANEVLSEYRGYANLEGLDYDRSMVIYYPLPLFLYMHKDDTAGIARVTKGIMTALNDGSLKALWDRHFKESVDFVAIDKRTMYRLENPLVHAIDFDFERYFYSAP